MAEQQFIVECPCGVVIREEDTAALIATVQHHAHSVHQMDLDEQQVMDMAHPA
ncbi:MAG: hypothetical protein WCP59_17020 [Actinomycetota bacterium]|jgi:hypothetical protein